MSELNQVTQEELQNIKQLQQDYAATTFQIGQITIELDGIQRDLKEAEAKKTTLLSNLTQLRESERTLSLDLEKKYGSTTIDLETGIIQR